MGLLDRLFRREGAKVTRLEVTGRAGGITSFGAPDPWQDDTFRSAVDSICRLAAKFQFTPTRLFRDGSTAEADPHLAHVLQVSPNPLLDAFSFWYSAYARLFTSGNSYSYVMRDPSGRVVALWPLSVVQAEFLTDSRGGLYLALRFANGKSTVLPYDSVVHFRRHCLDRDGMGDGPAPIATALSLSRTQTESEQQSLSQAQSLRGVVRLSGALSDEKISQYKSQFEQQFLSNQNISGVVITDINSEFTPIDNVITRTSEDERQAVRRRIFQFLGVPESVVSGDFSDDDFNAFSESVLESLALMSELELTRKLCDSPSRRIQCSTQRIGFMSNENKVKMLKECLPAGVLSINEARNMIGLQPVENDRRLQSLNYVSVDIADEYQLVRSGYGGVKSLASGSETEEGERDVQP